MADPAQASNNLKSLYFWVSEVSCVESHQPAWFLISWVIECMEWFGPIVPVVVWHCDWWCSATSGPAMVFRACFRGTMCAEWMGGCIMCRCIKYRRPSCLSPVPICVPIPCGVGMHSHGDSHHDVVSRVSPSMVCVVCEMTGTAGWVSTKACSVQSIASCIIKSNSAAWECCWYLEPSKNQACYQNYLLIAWQPREVAIKIRITGWYQNNMQTPNQSWGMVKEEIYSHNTFSKIQPKLQHTITTPQRLAQLVIM